MADSAPGGSEPSFSWVSVAVSRLAATAEVTGMPVRTSDGRDSSDVDRSSGRSWDQR